jgi:hypothetical protein
MMPSEMKCPHCGAQNATPVKYTLWGGWSGPAMLKLVKCDKCGRAYSGKTGKSAGGGIALHIAVTIVLLALLGWLLFMYLSGRM